MSGPFKRSPTHLLLAAAVLWALSGTGSGKESKRDMLGFFPGMSIEQFDDALVRLLEDQDKDQSWYVRLAHKIWGHPGCRSDRELNGNREKPCAIREGKLTFKFTKYAKPTILKAVSLDFYSGTDQLGLIKEVSSQYGLTPKTAPTQGSDGLNLFFSTVGINLKIAEWELPERQVLRLSGNYVLSLSSQDIENLDNRALNEEIISTNPKPKF